ncbi:hypothetical protein [Natrialba sp. INN-245]|uniref:hypothetical protein n=1 Tax=Natrialba sp. INN-245 TaxID=2690967 RepID=UPI001311B2E5|nr:hypothetical protein [Natrialba sp. INN-245]MWV40810.1 hypothetical protein [Natrialba sp. INN-245]
MTVDLRAISTDGEDELDENVTVDLRAKTVRTIRDPETSDTVEADEESTGVTVEATGDGLGPADLSVTNETPSSEDDYRAGPMVRIENRSAIDEAEVTIPLAEGVDPEDSDLSIYTWEPGSGEPWTPLESETDPENGTMSAEVDHFSVFRSDEWDDATSDTMVLEDRHLEDGTDVGLEARCRASEFGSVSGAGIWPGVDADSRADVLELEKGTDSALARRTVPRTRESNRPRTASHGEPKFLGVAGGTDYRWRPTRNPPQRSSNQPTPVKCPSTVMSP